MKCPDLSDYAYIPKSTKTLTARLRGLSCRSRVARLLLKNSFMGDCANRESRVLVLEDEAVLRRSLTRLLERRGLMVVAAATLQEARAHLRGTDIDAAILDVSLPDGDGLDLLPLTHADHSLVVCLWVLCDFVSLCACP